MQQFERSFTFDFKKQKEKNISPRIIGTVIPTIFFICVFINFFTMFFSKKPIDNSNLHSQPQIEFLKNQLETNLAEHGQFLYSKNHSSENKLSMISTWDEKENTFGCQIAASDIKSSAYASDVNNACNNAAFNFNSLIHEGEQQYLKEQMKISNKK